MWLLLAAISVLGIGTVGAGPAGGQAVGVIVIDPGHGGHDIGARGPDGTLEKDVNLALARLVADRLKKKGFQAWLTRTGDYGLNVFQRTAKANRAGGDMFVSIHTGGGFSFKKGGVDVFYISTAVDIGHDLSRFSETPPDIVWKAVNEQYVTANEMAATIIQRELADFSGQPSRLHEARLAVLEGADMPSVLVEVGCLVNPEEEKSLQSPEILSAVADRLCNGIVRFFKANGDYSDDNFRNDS